MWKNIGFYMQVNLLYNNSRAYKNLGFKNLLG